MVVIVVLRNGLTTCSRLIRTLAAFFSWALKIHKNCPDSFDCHNYSFAREVSALPLPPDPSRSPTPGRASVLCAAGVCWPFFVSLRHFGHLSHHTVALKLAVTVFTSLYIRTEWPNWQKNFRSFQKNFGLWPKKTDLLNNTIGCTFLILICWQDPKQDRELPVLRSDRRLPVTWAAQLNWTDLNFWNLRTLAERKLAPLCAAWCRAKSPVNTFCQFICPGSSFSGRECLLN